MQNPYQSIEAEIKEIVEETPAIKTFVLRPKEPFGFETGQFVQLAVPGLGEAPFTPSSDPDDKQQIALTIMNVGTVTGCLHNMRPGDKLGIRGPYGTGYPLEEFKGRGILIVGGGVGLAPLRSLLFALFNRIDKYERIVLRYGARTPEDIVYKQALDEWSKKEKVDCLTTVDVGNESWKGKVGLVTTILENLPIGVKDAVSIVCGPPIMMKFTTLKLLDLGFERSRIYLSMEKNMSCGLGKCGHCRIGKFYVCKDGPVFRYDKIKDMPDIWD
jgi:sulfite reductase subunit B